MDLVDIELPSLADKLQIAESLGFEQLSEPLWAERFNRHFLFINCVGFFDLLYCRTRFRMMGGSTLWSDALCDEWLHDLMFQWHRINLKLSMVHSFSFFNVFGGVFDLELGRRSVAAYRAKVEIKLALFI